MIVILSSLFIFYFYLFEIKFNKFLKLSLLIVGGIAVWFLINVPSKIDILLNTKAMFANPKSLKYSYYFFNLNIIFTIFFILSLSTIKRIKSKQFVIIISFLVLFFVHLVSSLDLQILRGILYFFPAYYLVSIYSVSRLNMKKGFIMLICLILLFTVINNYPKNFLKGPEISHEVFYIDYQEAYKFVIENTKNAIILSSPSPYNFEFYSNRKALALLTKKKNLINRKKIFYNNVSKEYEYSYGNFSILKDFKNINNFLEDKYVIIRTPSSFSLLDKNITDQLKKNHKIIYYRNIEIYKPQT